MATDNRRKDGWRETTLGAFTTLQRGHDLPTQDRRQGTVPILGSFGITGWHDTAKVRGPGVTVGRSGASFGVVSFSSSDFWPLNTALFVKNFNGNDERFAYYFLKTMDFKRYNSGSAVQSLNRNHVHPIPILIPPLPEQRAIANILGSLDDKIELNRRMNETLEGIARALFKSWFVDFDPVRAKMDGRQPAGMDPEIADLFPSEFTRCDLLGKIPQGWKTERFDKHMTVSRGLSYKGSGLSDAGMPMHNLNSIYEGGGYKYEGIKHYIGEYRDKHLVKPGDLIVTNTEQGFDRLLIGYAAIVPRYFGSKGIFSHHIYRVRVRQSSPLSPHYLLQLINSRRWHDWISGFSNGTTINMLPMDAFEMPLLVVPPSQLVEQFTEFAIAQSAKTEQVVNENHKLATLRDTLLPKLLSGELRVPEADKMVEEVL